MIIKQIFDSGKFRQKFQNNEESRRRRNGPKIVKNGPTENGSPLLTEVKENSPPIGPQQNARKERLRPSASLPYELNEVGKPKSLRSIGCRRLKMRKRIPHEVRNILSSSKIGYRAHIFDQRESPLDCPKRFRRFSSFIEF